MTTFSYSSGNPSNLTGGHSASMSDIAGPLTDIPTFLNGNIDATNLATSAKPVTLRGPYQTISESAIAIGTAMAGGTYYGVGSGAVAVASASAGTAPIILALTTSDYTVTGLTTQYRVKVSTITGTTAPGVNFTFGLYPVTATSGNTGSTIAVTLGTVVAGSTVVRTAPAATSQFLDASADFTIGSSGTYALGVLTSGLSATNSYTLANMRLEYHHI